MENTKYQTLRLRQGMNRRQRIRDSIDVQCECHCCLTWIFEGRLVEDEESTLMVVSLHSLMPSPPSSLMVNLPRLSSSFCIISLSRCSRSLYMRARMRRRSPKSSACCHCTAMVEHNIKSYIGLLPHVLYYFKDWICLQIHGGDIGGACLFIYFSLLVRNQFDKEGCTSHQLSHFPRISLFTQMIKQ